MLKSEIREKALALRSREDSKKSLIICKSLIETVEFSQARKIMIYMPIRDEVDTTQILVTAKAMGKKIYAPKVVDSEYMIAKEVTEMGFKKGVFGISEPLGAPAEGLDLLIVPAVAVDRRKRRVGYGKGYYDRFLKEKTGIKIALAYECQMFDEIPSEEHDVTLDFIITEKEIYR